MSAVQSLQSQRYLLQVRSVVSRTTVRGSKGGLFSPVLVVVEAANRQDPPDAGRLNTPSYSVGPHAMRSYARTGALCRCLQGSRSSTNRCTRSPCDSPSSIVPSWQQRRHSCAAPTSPSHLRRPDVPVASRVPAARPAAHPSQPCSPHSLLGPSSSSSRGTSPR